MGQSRTIEMPKSSFTYTAARGLATLRLNPRIRGGHSHWIFLDDIKE